MITHPSIQQDVFPAKYGNPKQLQSGSQCVPKCNNKYSIGLVAILVAGAKTTTLVRVKNRFSIALPCYAIMLGAT